MPGTSPGMTEMVRGNSREARFCPGVTAERVARMRVSDMRGGSGPGCRFAHPGYALTSSAAPGAAQNATRRPPLALAVRLWSDIAMPSMAPNTATFALVW